MPRLWNETIDEHRRDVRDAILDATAQLVGNHGLLTLTMSQIATAAGIGRATLYKYFADVEAVLLAWHERQLGRHLQQLNDIRDQDRPAIQRLIAVLETFAHIAQRTRHHRETELVAVLHRHPRVGQAQAQVQQLLTDLITEAGQAGDIRTDVPAEELAAYSLHAIAASAEMTDHSAIQRLIDVINDGLADRP